MPTTSETVAMDAGVTALGSTFNGITSFMANNWMFGALMAVTLVTIGVSVFKKVVARFGGRR